MTAGGCSGTPADPAADPASHIPARLIAARDMNDASGAAALGLDALPMNMPAVIERIDWDRLGEGARRLRALGFDEGVAIESLHHGGLFGRDPIACRVGRMTVALRRAQAAAVTVRPAAAA